MYCKLQSIIIVALLVASNMLMAKPVKIDQARAVAAHFAQINCTNFNIAADNGIKSLNEVSPFNEFYVFTGSNGKGFIIVAADDCVTPILGYSENGTFSFVDMPDQVREWLNGYEAQIRFCRINDIEPTEEIAQRWDNLSKGTQAKNGAKTGSNTHVDPLLTTTWNQTAAYARHLPVIDEYANTYAGCVAVATAQIMKYYNWPPHGRGDVSGIAGGITYSAHLNDTIFDWDNMTNSISNWSDDINIHAIATLIYNAGLAVNTHYGTTGSSAETILIGRLGYHTAEEALRDNFYYSHTINSVDKQYYTDSQWVALLKNELNHARPIFYAARATSSSGNTLGHAFILDGYDEDDYFHVNWGWGGFENGYFLLSALNHYISSSGETVTYSLDHRATIGIQPAQSMQPEDGVTTVIGVSSDPEAGYVDVRPASSSSRTGRSTGTFNNYTDKFTIQAVEYTGYRFKQWSDGGMLTTRSELANGGIQTFTAIYEPVEVTAGTPDSIQYDNDSTLYWVGTKYEAGIKIPYSSARKNKFIDRITIGARAKSGDRCKYVVRVYRGSTLSNASCLYTSDSIEVQNRSWITFALDESEYVTASNNLFITVSSQSGYPAFTKNSSSSANSYYYKTTSSGSWTSTNSNSYAYAIRCHLNVEKRVTLDEITTSNITASSATISWDAPTSATPYRYQVAWGEGDYPGLMENTYVNSTSFTINNLQGNTHYNVFVKPCFESSRIKGLWEGASFTTESNLTNPITIVAKANNETMGFVSGGGVYEYGSQVTLEAIPMPGYAFDYWDYSYDNDASTITITANSDAEYIAHFYRIGYPISTNITEGYGSIDAYCEEYWEEDGIIYYPYLSTLRLTAVPDEGYEFAGWSDGSTNNPKYVTVYEPWTYSASFVSDSKRDINITSGDGVIDVNMTQESPISIYDMLGRCVFTEPVSTNSVHVNINRPGVYLVKIGNEKTQKVIVR